MLKKILERVCTAESIARLCFSLNVLLFLSAIPAFVPFIVPSFIKLAAYSACVRLGLFANLIRLANTVGPFPTPITSLEGWKIWCTPFALSVDMHQMLFSVTFISGSVQLVAVIPLAARAFLLAMAYANKNFATNSLWLKYGKGKLYSYVETNLLQLMQMVTMIEISLGFLLIFDIIMSLHRGILRAFMYWHFLKLKYKYEQQKFSNSSLAYKQYHSQIWNQLHNLIVVPVVVRLPIVQKGVDIAVRWFRM